MAKRSKQTFWGTHAPKVLVGTMALVCAGCVYLVVQLSGLSTEPEWWYREIGDAESAERLENAITTQLTAVRPKGKERWSVALEPEEVNAWLAHRLRATISTHQGEDSWPSGLVEMRVAIEDDELLAGALIDHDSGRSYAWSTCTLAVDGDELLVGFEKPRIGTTRVPSGAMGTVLKNGTTKSFRAYLDLEDGRIAKVIAVRVRGGRVELALETTIKAGD